MLALIIAKALMTTFICYYIKHIELITSYLDIPYGKWVLITIAVLAIILLFLIEVSLFEKIGIELWEALQHEDS